MKILKSLFVFFFFISLASPVNASDYSVTSNSDLSRDTVVYNYGMVYNFSNVSTNGSLIQPLSTFYGDCGSVVLTASGGILNVVIRPNFVVWSFTGAVTDSLTGAWFMSAHSLDNSDTFNLTRKYKNHIITLTGTATDITGVSCSVVPNATISHYY